MKRCINPNCETAFLFGDDKTVCPFCRGPLTNELNGVNVREPRITPADRVRPERNANEAIPFITRRFGSIECRGRITEIDHHEVFYSPRHKFVNSFFGGEPYQLAHQSIEYTVRVENITDTYATEVSDFCFFGNYLGRMQVGDEVIIKANDSGGRRIARSVYNLTTSSRVRNGLVLPAWLVRILTITLVFFVSALIGGAVAFIESGALTDGIVSLVCALLPVVLVIVGIRMLFNYIFRRRR